MEFSFNVDDKREGIRRGKEKVWEGLNEISDFVLEITEETNQQTEFNEKYNPSLKLMHHCVAKFAAEMNDLLDDIGNSQSAQITLKEIAAKKASRALAGELFDDQSEAIEGSGDGSDDDGNLSDSKFDVKCIGAHTFITHKGFKYRKHSTKTNTPFGFSEGKYKCVGKSKTCTGSVEPIKKSNGKVHIRGIDDHSCK